MPLVKTEAVVLKCDNYRETSKIITFYTKSHGKLKGIAKGVRNSKSRWGGALQSMAIVNVMYYYKETRTLHLVSGAEYASPLNQIFSDYEKMQCGFRMIELVNRTTAEMQENTKIYNLLVSSLQMLDTAGKNYINTLFFFKFRLLDLLGFRPDLTNLNDIVENNGTNQYFYETNFNAGDVKAIEALSEGNFNLLITLNITKPQQITLDRFFDNYLRDHFEHASFSNAKKVFRSQELL